MSLIIGINMAFRRQLAEVIGGFDTDLGPGTPDRMVCEDLDFLYRAFKAGHRILYSPDVLLFHNHGRRSATDRSRLNQTYLWGRGGFYLKHILRGDRQVLRAAYWELSGLLKECVGALCRDFQPGPSCKVLGPLLVGSGRMAKRRLLGRLRGKRKDTGPADAGLQT